MTTQTAKEATVSMTTQNAKEPKTATTAKPVKVNLRDFSMLIALVLISVVFSVMDPAFLSSRNLSQLAIELSATAVLSLGMLLIIVPGHIDLSVGSGLGLVGGLAAVLITGKGLSAPLALLVSALVSVAIYAGMGAIIVKEKIPSFIITLGGLLVFKGVHWLVINNSTIPVVTGGDQNVYSILTTYYLPPVLGYVLAAVIVGLLGLASFNNIKKRRAHKLEADGEGAFLSWFLSAQLLGLFVMVLNQYRGLPLSLLVLGATAFVIHVLSQHFRFGRYLYAIGGNEEAALVSGVPTGKVVVLAYAVMGVIVAISGFLQTAFAGASTTTTGALMELDAIAACVIGGTSLKGGRGTVVGVLFGALIMCVLLNGMTLLALSPEMKFIARGVVLALAVWMDVRLSRSTARA